MHQVNSIPKNSERLKSPALKLAIGVLSDWSSGVLSKGLFVKLIYQSEAESALPIGFCVVRIIQVSFGGMC